MSDNRRTWLKTKYEVRTQLGHYPSVFIPWMRYRHRGSDVVIHNSTSVMIEGFPRSGNTFAVAAFELTQREPVSIARHLHAPAHVVRAVQASIPTLILIREPDEAVLSLVIRSPFLSLEQGFRHYAQYYQALESFRQNFLLASFQEVISDFGKVTEALNLKFGTSFAVFSHTDENVRKAFKRIDQMDMKERQDDQVQETSVARPSEERDAMKQRLLSSMNELQNYSYRQQANELYRQWTST